MNSPLQRMVQSVAFCSVFLIAFANGAKAQTTARNSDTETIFYSARYYSRPGSGATSHRHLYSIDARGGKSRQLTFGRLDEDTPRVSSDHRTLAFTRIHADYSVDVCALDLKTKRVRVLLPAAKDIYISDLAWSPDGKTLAAQRELNASKGASALYLIDFPSRKLRRFPNVTSWAWRPQTSQIRLSDRKGTRLLDINSKREMPMSSAFSDMVWLGRETSARIVTKTVGKPDADPYAKLQSVDILALNGQKLRSVVPQKVSGIRKSGNLSDGMDGEDVEFDGLALLLPIPGQSADLLLVANERTSSGAEFAFTRFDARNGQTRFLARGTRLSWDRDAKRFAVVDYHDTLPYDTLANGHKRWVYTARLLVGDGNGALRPLVSGLVLVSDCDWSR